MGARLLGRGLPEDSGRKSDAGVRAVEAVSKQLQAENRPRITVKQPFEKKQ